jgi:hypothetical protein
VATLTTSSLSRQAVRDALSHRQPSRLPVDFGATSVTGIHVTCVSVLRDYYGLDQHPVKVHEPYQMLGMIEDDLKQAMGIDTEGLFRRDTMFGFPNENWKPWNFNGLEVLIGGGFNTTIDAKGDTLVYPQGDMTAKPSGRLPKGGFFFDTIVRQDHFDEAHLNPEDNLEEFAELTDAEAAVIAEDARAARATGRAVVAGLGGTAFGDIALVPAPGMKDPRGIRDIAEWYMSTTIFTPSSAASAKSRSGISKRSGRRQAMISTCCSCAEPILARRLPRSARSARSATCTCRTTSRSAAGSIAIPIGNVSNIPAVLWIGSSNR